MHYNTVLLRNNLTLRSRSKKRSERVPERIRNVVRTRVPVFHRKGRRIS